MAPVEQIRDLSPRRNRFDVTVVDSALFDVMLATWSAFGGDDKVSSHELGKKWFDRFRTAISTETLTEMERLGLTNGSLWAALLSYLAVTGPSETDAILDWLRADDGDLVTGLLVDLCWQAEEEDLSAAMAGDEDACERVLDHCKPGVQDGMHRLKAAGPRLGESLARILASVYDTAYRDLGPGWSEAIEASAVATRRLAEIMEPRPLIEQITNGIDYEIPLGMTRLVAIPTVSLRPWTLVTQFDDAVVVSYAVADDHLEADPDAPPGWLVRFHKALGDARRMRILRRLAEGPATLGQLTEMVGLAKSTVFHHIGVLRAAGLVRVTVGHGSDQPSSYELRRNALEDAGLQLDKYLDIPLLPKEAT